MQLSSEKQRNQNHWFKILTKCPHGKFPRYRKNYVNQLKNGQKRRMTWLVSLTLRKFFSSSNFCFKKFSTVHHQTFVLQRDVDKRLGCNGGVAEELKNHPFFLGVDWVQVRPPSPPGIQVLFIENERLHMINGCAQL